MNYSMKLMALGTLLTITQETVAEKKKLTFINKLHGIVTVHIESYDPKTKKYSEKEVRGIHLKPLSSQDSTRTVEIDPMIDRVWYEYSRKRGLSRRITLTSKDLSSGTFTIPTSEHPVTESKAK